MKALEGVRILDMTHVQSGPTCTQLLAWFGADVIKVERPGTGDVTRHQLRDIEGVDSLYFTMLNSNKRSLTLNTKTEKGKHGAHGANDYAYVIIQPQGWEPLMKIIGREDLIEDPEWATPEARLTKLDDCFALVEGWTITKDKFEVMEILNAANVPCGPVLSMKELAEEESLRVSGTVVEVDHPERGKYLTVGNPVKLSDSPVDVGPSPLLGEHTEEILRDIVGLDDEEIKAAKSEGAI